MYSIWLTLVLFDLDSILSYVLAYFTLDFDMIVILFVPISVVTLEGIF